MAFEGSEVSTGGQIPKLDGLVVARADQNFSVRGDDKITDPALVTGQRFLLDHSGHLKELDGGVPAAGDQEFCIRGEGHRADPVVHRFLESAVVFDKIATGFG